MKVGRLEHIGKASICNLLVLSNAVTSGGAATLGGEPALLPACVVDRKSVRNLLLRCLYIKISMADSLQGSLDLLVLKILSRKPKLHGYAIMTAIQERSDEILRVEEGSLYPALHRMEEDGWIRAEWKDSDLGRSAKFYGLTKEGRKQLERELRTWERLSSAVRLLIENA